LIGLHLTEKIDAVQNDQSIQAPKQAAAKKGKKIQ